MGCKIGGENCVLEKDLQKFVQDFSFIEEISDKTILITGATGLIGSLLVKSLLKINRTHKTGIKVIGVARDKNKRFETDKVNWIIQDIKEPLPANLKANYLFHCAGATSSKFMIQHPVDVLETMFIGTEQVLRFSKDSRVESIVYLSSIESYGSFSSDKEIDENESGYINPLNARSCYPIGKKAAESLCYSYFSEYDVPVKIARLTQTFGPGIKEDDNRVFAQFARNAINKEPIILHTEGGSSKSYCYTLDALNALFYILLRGNNGEAYNIANPETYISVKEMANMVSSKFAGSSVKIKKEEDQGYAPETKTRLKVDKLLQLGWAPSFKLEEMYSHLIDYLIEENERNNN